MAQAGGEFAAFNFTLRKLVQADFKGGKLSISSNLWCDRYSYEALALPISLGIKEAKFSYY